MSASPNAVDATVVLSDEVRDWIGRTTDLIPLPEEISASDIRRYADATGDRNPLWLDDDAVRAAGYRARIVPPILVIELIWRLQDTELGRMTDRVPLPPEFSDTRNAETEIEWFTPAHMGDRVSIRSRIVDIEARAGRRGLGVHIRRETEYLNQDHSLLARVRQTVIRYRKVETESP